MKSLVVLASLIATTLAFYGSYDGGYGRRLRGMRFRGWGGKGFRGGFGMSRGFGMSKGYYGGDIGMSKGFVGGYAPMIAAPMIAAPISVGYNGYESAGFHGGFMPVQQQVIVDDSLIRGLKGGIPAGISTGKESLVAGKAGIVAAGSNGLEDSNGHDDNGNGGISGIKGGLVGGIHDDNGLGISKGKGSMIGYDDNGFGLNDESSLIGGGISRVGVATQGLGVAQVQPAFQTFNQFAPAIPQVSTGFVQAAPLVGGPLVGGIRGMKTGLRPY